jgi:flavin-dependent dehydrogenase
LFQENVTSLAMTIDTQVLVIGGGPAGVSTALTCAQSSLDVWLIERAPFPRDHPGESLHPGIEPLLRQMGVWDEVLAERFLRHDGHWIDWGGKPRFEAFGADDTERWRGLQAWRATFDAILLRRARSAGVKILQPCRAIRPIVAEGVVQGALTSAGAIRAQVVVDAAGDRHWLARRLKMATLRCSPPLLACYGYARGECPIRDRAPAIVADNTGWTWTARVRPGLYAWTRLVFDSKCRDNPLQGEADRLPAEFKGLQPQGKPRGADVTWRRVASLAGPGYFIVGDAAAVLDPASSHGVLRAVMSGMMAGHLVSRVCKQGLTHHQASGTYCDWMCEWFEHDAKRLRGLYENLGAAHFACN